MSYYDDIDKDTSIEQLLTAISGVGVDVTARLDKLPVAPGVEPGNRFAGLIAAGKSDLITSDNYNGG